MNFVRTVARARVPQLITAAVAVHILMELSGLPREFLNTFATALSLTLAIGVLFVYLPVASKSFLAPSLDSIDRISWGIVFSWGSRVLLSVVSLITLLTGIDLNFNETGLFGLVFIFIALAASFHIMSPTQMQARPYYNWPLLIFAIATGSVICGIVIGIALTQRGLFL